MKRKRLNSEAAALLLIQVILIYAFVLVTNMYKERWNSLADVTAGVALGMTEDGANAAPADEVLAQR